MSTRDPFDTIVALHQTALEAIAGYQGDPLLPVGSLVYYAGRKPPSGKHSTGAPRVHYRLAAYNLTTHWIGTNASEFYVSLSPVLEQVTGAERMIGNRFVTTLDCIWPVTE